jgi:hypothetical protein
MRDIESSPWRITFVQQKRREFLISTFTMSMSNLKWPSLSHCKQIKTNISVHHPAIASLWWLWFRLFGSECSSCIVISCWYSIVSDMSQFKRRSTNTVLYGLKSIAFLSYIRSLAVAILIRKHDSPRTQFVMHLLIKTNQTRSCWKRRCARNCKKSRETIFTWIGSLSCSPILLQTSQHLLCNAQKPLF